MTNQQKPSELDDLIAKSEISSSIKSLSKALSNYSKTAKNKHYIVYQKILTTTQQLHSLENQLYDLIQTSKEAKTSD